MNVRWIFIVFYENAQLQQSIQIKDCTTAEHHASLSLYRIHSFGCRLFIKTEFKMTEEAASCHILPSAYRWYF